MSSDYGSVISTDGLVLCLDAANPKSYSGSGTSWNDVSGNGNHFSILATAYNSSGPKYMDFNGSYGCAKKLNSDLSISGDVTAVVWTRVKNSTAEWRTLFRGLSSGGDHQVIIQSGGWNIGMYDNVNGSGFNDTGYSQQSLPGYGTTQWNMLVWRWSSVSYSYSQYNFSYNNTPSVTRGSISSNNARFKHGICSIGAYNNGSQNDPASGSQWWGDIAHVSMYNRYLADDEIIKAYNSGRGRFAL